MPTGVTTSSKYADLVTVIVTAVELAVFWALHTYVVTLDLDISAAASEAAAGLGIRTQSGLRNGSCVTSAGSRRASRSRRSRR